MRTFAAALLALTACGGKPASSTTTPAPAPTRPTHGEEAEPRGDTSKAGDPSDQAVCATRSDMFGPFMLDLAQAQRRYGANARTFGDAPTTKMHAIEVCGITASQQWLRGTACADGSSAKQNGRSGSVGLGGRCRAVIDLYTVTCPEREYEVYIDMYMCGPDESFR